MFLKVDATVGKPPISGEVEPDSVKASLDLTALRLELYHAQREDPSLKEIISTLEKKAPGEYLAYPRADHRCAQARAYDFLLADDGVLLKSRALRFNSCA